MGKNLGMRMKAVREREALSAATQSTGVSDRMVESVRQSLRVEGYDVPTHVVRDVAERTLAAYH